MIDTHQCSVLLVDDDISLLRSTQFTLELAGIGPVSTLSDSRHLLASLTAFTPQVVLLDLSMPFLSGLELLPIIRQKHPHISILILTATYDLETAVACIKLGADDYVTKPVEREKLIGRIKKMGEMHRLTGKLLREEPFADILTQSPTMIRIFNYLESIAHSNEPVLIIGETGVGKELIAKALHRLGREGRPFVIENVAGLDDTMFSDTLFGHIKGAFTGAESDRLGLAAKSGNGTLVLDEVGDLSPNSQIKLLRLLQERSYSPLGSDILKPFQGRILATTHRDLEQAIGQGSFRQDLFYRMASHTVHIPPLRKRREDIPLLLAHFVQEASKILNHKIPLPPSNLADLLANYAFPGNIRELRSMVMDAASRYKGSGPLPLEPFMVAIRKRTYHHEISSEQKDSADQSFPLHIKILAEAPLPTLREGLKQMETFLVTTALQRTSHNKNRAAAILGLSRQAFYKRFQNKS